MPMLGCKKATITGNAHLLSFKMLQLFAYKEHPGLITVPFHLQHKKGYQTSKAAYNDCSRNVTQNPIMKAIRPKALRKQ